MWTSILLTIASVAFGVLCLIYVRLQEYLRVARRSEAFSNGVCSPFVINSECERRQPEQPEMLYPVTIIRRHA